MNDIIIASGLRMLSRNVYFSQLLTFLYVLLLNQEGLEIKIFIQILEVKRFRFDDYLNPCHLYLLLFVIQDTIECCACIFVCNCKYSFKHQGCVLVIC